MSKNNRVSRAEQQRRTAELLQQMSGLSSSGNVTGSISSKPTTKAGETPGGVIGASTIGVAIANGVGRNFQREIIDSNIHHNYLASKGLIEEAIRSGVKLLDGPVSKANIIEATIRGLKEDDSNIYAALDLAEFCFKNGINYESQPSNPITTRTLICAGQNAGDNQTTIKNASTMAAAIRAGLVFDPKMVRLSAIKARDGCRERENTLAYADLALASVEKVAQPPDTEEALAFYSTVIATLANPTIQIPDERSLVEVAERANLAVDLALAVLDKNVPLHKVMPVGKLKMGSHQRMDALVKDLRMITEKLHGLNDAMYLLTSSRLSDEEVSAIVMREIVGEKNLKITVNEINLHVDSNITADLRVEGDKLYEKALKLLKRVLKNYEIEPITVNSTLSTVSKISLQLNKPISEALKNIVRESLENNDIRPGIEREVLDRLVQVMIGAVDSRIQSGRLQEAIEIAPSAVDIASLAFRHGKAFHPITLGKIVELKEKVDFSRRNDVLGKIDELQASGLEVSRREFVIGSTAPEVKTGLLEGTGLVEVTDTPTLKKTRVLKGGL